ncbi:MAG: ATP-binding protein, partial [Myxococcota bacterium]
ADLRTLDDALAQAQAGNGQVLGIVAEAGTGKSRLCFEFSERCRAHGLTVLEGQAVAHGKNLPLLPILQVFRAYYGIDERDDDRTVRERIAGRQLLLDEGFREVLPVMFEFFGVPDPERPAPHMEPEAKQRVLFGVLRKMVQGADPRAGAQNFVTLIEDLHWMDAASEAFLEQWVDALAGGRGLLILNFRPEYRAEWMQKSYYRQIPLAPLGPAAVAELLADLLGRDPSLTGLAGAVHARTGGNPFFTEEVAQALIESGQLQGERGAYRLVTALDKLEVPSRVQAVLAARIDRLPEREKQLLQTAAVIGKEFSQPVLLRVAGLAERDLAESLAALRRAEFVYEGSLYPVAEYAFKHPLTQEVALGSQLRERRARTHAAVARALEAAHEGRLDEHAALLAHHYEEADETLEAARWHRRAAEWLLKSDLTESTTHWERVYELAKSEASTPEAMTLRLRACSRLVMTSYSVGLTEKRERLAAEGRDLAEQLGDRVGLCRLEFGLANARTLTGGWSESPLVPAKRAVEIAADLDLRTQAEARFLLGAILWHGGRVPDALRVIEEALELAGHDLEFGAEHYGMSLNNFALFWKASALQWRGRHREATACLERCAEVARERNEHFVLCMVNCWSGSPHEELTGTSHHALSLGQHAVEWAERSGASFDRTVALLY